MRANRPGQRARWVKIVATLGPATSSPERIEQLLTAGVDVVRLNFSHGTRAEHAESIRQVRAISERLGRWVALLQDLQGPKIRVGALQGGGPVALVDGARLTITTRPVVGTAALVSTTYQQLPQDVTPGDRILLDDGMLELRVLATRPEEVETEVVHGGPLGEHKGINLPGVAVSAPALTEKDIDDLRFGLAHGVDYVALSFVRRPADVAMARDVIRQCGADVPIIVKLEKPEALDELEAILSCCDGVMVARGDLGVEMPPEQVPLAQKRIIRRALARAMPVITATQMLQSMVTDPRPTRAEASDVANAVLDGTDAVMLSAETAIGRYPIQAVTFMGRIAHEVELEAAALHGNDRRSAPTRGGALAQAAVDLAEAVKATAIVVITESGRTAKLLAATRPSAPIFAVTDDPVLARRLSLLWGVVPILDAMTDNTDAMIDHIDQVLRQRQLVAAGDLVVIIGSAPMSTRGRTNFVKLQVIGRRALPDA